MRNVSAIAKKSLPRQTRYEIQPLTKEQAHMLLEQARGEKSEALLILALTTGMRRGELNACRERLRNNGKMGESMRERRNVGPNHMSVIEMVAPLCGTFDREVGTEEVFQSVYVALPMDEGSWERVS